MIGYYPASQMEKFVADMQQHYNVSIRYAMITSLVARTITNFQFTSFFRYLQEFTMLGTAGGMYHFRDQIRVGNPTAFFVLNGDVCSDFPLTELYEFHKTKNGQAEVRSF